METRKAISPITDHLGELMFIFASPCYYLLLHYSHSSLHFSCQSFSHTSSSLMLCPVLAFTTSAQTLWWVRQSKRRTIIIFSQITFSRCQGPHVEAANCCLQINCGIILQAYVGMCVWVCVGGSEGEEGYIIKRKSYVDPSGTLSAVCVWKARLMRVSCRYTNDQTGLPAISCSHPYEQKESYGTKTRRGAGTR